MCAPNPAIIHARNERCRNNRTFLDWSARQIEAFVAVVLVVVHWANPPIERKFALYFCRFRGIITALFTRIQEERQMATDIRSLVEEFVNQVVAAVEADSVRRVQQAVTAAFGGGAVAPRRRGRPPRAAVASVSAGPARRRPKQLCPVPGCTGVAAPVFGMVCAKHKDMPKAKIKEFRAARRAAKAGKK